MDPLSPRERPDQRSLSSDPQPAESTTIPMANSDPFTCTFCRGTSTGRPRVLGRSARLACEACHSALLNLSICWVCGEMIVRGDECVSLGWCFWHRACYGCLLCGCRRLCSGVPVAGDGSTEVSEPPLCAMCVVDVEADGMDELSMVQRGLRRISLIDGGVTRRRWLSRLRHGMVSSLRVASLPSSSLMGFLNIGEAG